jgi:hypothetical protein
MFRLLEWIKRCTKGVTLKKIFFETVVLPQPPKYWDCRQVLPHLA